MGPLGPLTLPRGGVAGDGGVADEGGVRKARDMLCVVSAM